VEQVVGCYGNDFEFQGASLSRILCIFVDI